MIMENQDNNKQTGLGEVGSRLVSLYPDFDVRSYGYSSLSKFFEEFDRIQLVKHGHVAWVTLKENRARKEDVDQFVRNLVKVPEKQVWILVPSEIVCMINTKISN